jgi:integrase
MDKVFPRLADTTAKQRRYHIDKLILPKLGTLPAREVTTGDVIALVEGISKKSVSVAELVLTACSEIFKHGIARHVVTSNPCATVSLSAICGKSDPKRTRLMLTEAELRIILSALPAMGSDNTLAVKVLLATCVRIGELVRAKWEDVDLERAEWRVTDANSKTGKGITIPLTPAVVSWFTELKRLACESPYVMPARQTRRSDHCEPRSLNAMIHKLCDRLEKNGTPVRRFTPHDLRSTARSWLTSDLIGASIVVAERCLNHSLGGLLAVYDQHDYLTERRAVLERWTEMIVACETGQPWMQASKKVVPMRRGAV